ncbi:MAG: 23S rRNA (adenine(2503)-C(2))-methyltransferase RlmN [Bacilli bacterium]|nr:23S rRNA (adenine(2503)-C(2))-methyltransferase RlmN [Bacilli bacterium]MDD4809123.1 23S rRNA (adenine(2503)-C(2))-methyltransferase RlmN [Bacilli bacterium]
MINIYDYSLSDLETTLLENNFKKYNASQIYDWLYKKRVTNFNDMTNLKKELIKYLNDYFIIEPLKIVKVEKDTNVHKFLFGLSDNTNIEAVLMNHDYGDSLCISTQVGCNMNCQFCESGRNKKIRNLETYEMVSQVMQVEEWLKIRLTHVVLMGIGEPFDNYDNVINFVNIINESKGIALGSRHITVSTCGVVPKIEEFTYFDKQVNLAISLHAPNDEIRNKLMPINKVYNLDKLMNAIKKYIKVTNRRVTFEYIMLKEINDSYENAIKLSKLIKGINCYVNLIPYNETSYSDLVKSDKKAILEFYDCLKKNKINVTIRKEFGSKVSAACGQLRSNYEEEQ